MRLTLEKAKELMNHAASVMEGKENFLRHSTSEMCIRDRSYSVLQQLSSAVLLQNH